MKYFYVKTIIAVSNDGFDEVKTIDFVEEADLEAFADKWEDMEMRNYDLMDVLGLEE